MVRANGLNPYQICIEFVINLTTSKEEQAAICDYLDSQCTAVEEVIATKKEQLEVLGEYKKSLIFEYVTGKKEVI